MFFETTSFNRDLSDWPIESTATRHLLSGATNFHQEVDKWDADREQLGLENDIERRSMKFGGDGAEGHEPTLMR